MTIPVGIVVFIYHRWVHQSQTLFLALFRMLIQLLLIGYLLAFIFDAQMPIFILAVLSIMLIAASIIALRPLKKREPKLYLYTFTSIFIGSVFTLIIVIIGVVKPSPWFEPHILIPLAGMIFANAMNAVSLAAERFASEIKKLSYEKARAASLQAALIPIINSLFAVGLVSLPGMMTGQILSGIEPHIAARYQIMVMLMILGSAGISVSIYLMFMKKSR
ncbi:MAG: ABC transporter permease [Epsilonproteobacteria bacterium]|nr:ABC transporter permease [Campylobacterota bacterium]